MSARSDPPARLRDRLRAREVAFAAALALAATGLCLWFAARTRPWSDEGAVLTATAKLLRGGVFYRDVDAYWLPGSAYLLALAMRLFGEDLAVARALAGAGYVTTVLALYALGLRLVGFQRAAGLGLALLCLKILAWPGWTAYLYWDLAFAAACLAILALLAGRDGRPRSLAAGVFIGLAFLFKQNVGIGLGGAGLALLLLPGLLPGAGRTGPERRRAALGLVAGAGVVVGPTVLYFAAHGLADELLWAAFARPVVDYLPTGGISFAKPLAWWQLGSLGPDEPFYFVEPYVTLLRKGAFAGSALRPAAWILGEVFTRLLYTSVVLAGAGAVLLAWRRRRRLDEGDRRYLAFAVLAAAGTASAFPRADLTHVIAVHPLVLLALLGLWERCEAGLGAGARRTLRGTAAMALAGLLLGSGALALFHQAQRTERLDLPRARLWVPREHAWLGPVVRHVADALGPEEPFFVYGHEAHLYFLSGRFFPWPFSQLYPGQAGGDGGAALAGLLRSEAPEILVRGRTGSEGGLPPLRSYAPRLEDQVLAQFAPDLGFFRRHPPSGGALPPLDTASVWRPRARAAPAGQRQLPGPAPDGHRRRGERQEHRHQGKLARPQEGRAGVGAPHVGRQGRLGEGRQALHHPAPGIDHRRDPGVGGQDDPGAELHGAEDRVGQMEIGVAAPPEPGVVRQVQDQPPASGAELPEEIRIGDLEADRRGQPNPGRLQEPRAGPGDVGGPRRQLGDQGRQPREPSRLGLGEGDQPLLVVAGEAGLARTEDDHGVGGTPLVGQGSPGDQGHPVAVDQLPQRGRDDRRPIELPVHGGLGPDEQVHGGLRQESPAQRQVPGRVAERRARPEALRLGHGGLDHPHAERRALALAPREPPAAVRQRRDHQEPRGDQGAAVASHCRDPEARTHRGDAEARQVHAAQIRGLEGEGHRGQRLRRQDPRQAQGSRAQPLAQDPESREDQGRGQASHAGSQRRVESGGGRRDPGVGGDQERGEGPGGSEGDLVLHRQRVDQPADDHQGHDRRVGVGQQEGRPGASGLGQGGHRRQRHEGDGPEAPGREGQDAQDDRGEQKERAGHA